MPLPLPLPQGLAVPPFRTSVNATRQQHPAQVRSAAAMKFLFDAGESKLLK